MAHIGTDYGGVTYEAINDLIARRKDQLEELSKEEEKANLEWRLLRDLENTLWKLTKIQHTSE